MRIVVDRDLCVGAGQCVLWTPELFDQSTQDGRVVARATVADVSPRARAAVDLCPSGALSLLDE
jgi:ferredoxin